LRQPQFELLAAHGIGNLHRLKDFRREKWQAGKLQALSFCQRIPELQCPMVGNADDISGIGNVEQIAALGEERYDPVGTNILVVTRDSQVHAAFEPAGTDADEGDTIAVCRIHVGLNLEHYSRKPRFVRLHVTLQCAA
jgi:hypothetical protein